MSEVKGFKVFKSDWSCRYFQYEVGKTFEQDVTPRCCEAGFHFCLEAVDCFKYYDYSRSNKVAEVVALGDVDYSDKDSKCCTNKIQIVREISWDEVQRIVNLGKDCTGIGNTGNGNTGDWNTGDKNTGYKNTGRRNAGDGNTGDLNTGHGNAGNGNTGDWNTGNGNAGNLNTGDDNFGSYNTGDKNLGNRNTGDDNLGHDNTGDWNKSSHNNGCFMTIEPKIMMFNKPTDWTYRQWRLSDAFRLLNKIPRPLSENAQALYDGLSSEDKAIIKSLPNFDAGIFKEITGIDTN